MFRTVITIGLFGLLGQIKLLAIKLKETYGQVMATTSMALFAKQQILILYLTEQNGLFKMEE